jgi:hypothetical protein
MLTLNKGKWELKNFGSASKNEAAGRFENSRCDKFWDTSDSCRDKMISKNQISSRSSALAQGLLETHPSKNGNAACN